jgi:hypothetical protein
MLMVMSGADRYPFKKSMAQAIFGILTPKMTDSLWPKRSIFFL